MTENRAVELLEYIRETGNGEAPYVGCAQNIAIDMAIQALSEIQQYRAIGTVEDIQLIFSLCKDLERIVKKYEAIGTVEELQVLNRIAEETAEYVKEDKKILEAYKRIGTIEEFKDLKEKNEPKKPLLVPTDDTCLYQEYRCPSCDEWLEDKFKPYRCKCGQALDWS